MQFESYIPCCNHCSPDSVCEFECTQYEGQQVILVDVEYRMDRTPKDISGYKAVIESVKCMTIPILSQLDGTSLKQLEDDARHDFILSDDFEEPDPYTDAGMSRGDFA